jgi:hypothetical protein
MTRCRLGRERARSAPARTAPPDEIEKDGPAASWSIIRSSQMRWRQILGNGNDRGMPLNRLTRKLGMYTRSEIDAIAVTTFHSTEAPAFRKSIVNL